MDYFKRRGRNIELIDLRIMQSCRNRYGGVEKRVKLSGDPRVYCVSQSKKRKFFNRNWGPAHPEAPEPIHKILRRAAGTWVARLHQAFRFQASAAMDR